MKAYLFDNWDSWAGRSQEIFSRAIAEELPGQINAYFDKQNQVRK